MIRSLVCLLSGACRGIRPLSGLGPAIRRTGTLRHAEWYTRAETSGWHFRRRSVPDLALSPPLLEFDARSSRDSAPLASVGIRPATGMSTGLATSSLASRDTIVPASHRSRSQSSRDSTPEGWCKPGVQLSAWNTAPPDISLRAVTTQAIRLEYGTALSKVCWSYCQPGVKLSVWNTAR